MSERVLSVRELNRALLARQLLLERARLSIPGALERIGGIQNQYAPNACIRLWSCLEGFRRDDLTRALERRIVVQGTLMRETIHVVSARDYWLFALGTRRARRDWWLGLNKGADERQVQAAAGRLRAFLAAGARRAAEVDDFLGPERRGVHLWLELVRVPPSGTWERRRADLYAAGEDWLPAPQATEEEGLEHLARRYLAGFGPAPPADLAKWAGAPVTFFADVLDRMQLRRFRDESGRELIDLPRAPLPHPETPAPVRFLPTWDATLLVHARRTGILPEQYRPIVFETKNPFSMHTFLVDGVVAGRWKVEEERGKATLTLEPFERLTREAREALKEEGERLLRLFHPEAASYAVRA